MDISKIFPYEFSEGECGKAEFCYWFFFRDDEYENQTINSIISSDERYRNIASKSAMYNFFKHRNLLELHQKYRTQRKQLQNDLPTQKQNDEIYKKHVIQQCSPFLDHYMGCPKTKLKHSLSEQKRLNNLHSNNQFFTDDEEKFIIKAATVLCTFGQGFDVDGLLEMINTINRTRIGMIDDPNYIPLQRDYAKSFLKRHTDLSELIKSKPVDKIREDATCEEIRNATFTKLDSLTYLLYQMGVWDHKRFSDIPREQLSNSDEMGMNTFKRFSRKLIGPNSYEDCISHTPHQRCDEGDGRTRDHTTVMVTTRADGMYCVPKDGIEGAAPPFVIHSNKRGQKDYDSSTRSLIDVENSRVDMCKSSQSHGLYTSEESTACDDLPLSSSDQGYGFDARSTNNGSMEQHIFLDFAVHFVKHLSSDQGKDKKAHMLHLDGHGSRWSIPALTYLMANNVWPFFLPSHTSITTQANDNGENQAVHQAISKKTSEMKHGVDLSSVHGKNLVIREAWASHVKEEMQKLIATGSNIATYAWCHCGYVPFDVDCKAWEQEITRTKALMRIQKEVETTDSSNQTTKSQLPNYEPFPRFIERIPIMLNDEELESFIESYEYMNTKPGFLYEVAYLRAHNILSRWREKNDSGIHPESVATSPGDKIAMRYMHFVQHEHHIQSVRQRNHIDDCIKQETMRKQKALEAMSVWVDSFVLTEKNNNNAKARLTKELNNDESCVFVVVDNKGNQTSFDDAYSVLDTYNVELKIPHEQRQHYQRKLSIQAKNIAKQNEENAKTVSRQLQRHFIHSLYQSMVRQIETHSFSFEKFEHLLHQIYAPYSSNINGYHVTTSYVDVSKDLAVDPLVYNVVKDGISGKRYHKAEIDALKQSNKRRNDSDTTSSSKSSKRSRRTPDTKMGSTGVIANHHLQMKQVMKENQSRIQTHKELKERIATYKNIVKDLDSFVAKGVDFDWQSHGDSNNKDHKAMLKTLCRMCLPRYGWGKLGTTTSQEKIKLLKASNCPLSKVSILERKEVMIREIAADERSYNQNDAGITKLINDMKDDKTPHDSPNTTTSSSAQNNEALPLEKDIRKNKNELTLSPESESIQYKNPPVPSTEDEEAIPLSQQQTPKDMISDVPTKLSQSSIASSKDTQTGMQSTNANTPPKLRTQQIPKIVSPPIELEKQSLSHMYMKSLETPIHQEYRITLQYLFNAPCVSEEQRKQEVTSLDGHSVNLSSMQRLRPVTNEHGILLQTRIERESRYLNDEIVNYYLWMLEIRNYVQCNHHQYLRCAFFSSYLIKKLIYDSGESVDMYNYDLVKSWSIRICNRFGVADIFHLGKLIIPICTNKHWSCIIVHMNERKIQRYDPLGFRDCKGHMNAVMDYIRDEWRCYRGGDVEPDWTEWTFQDTNEYSNPKQENSMDCGMFVLFFAFLESIGLPHIFNQTNINLHARENVALSLLHKRLFI